MENNLFKCLRLYTSALAVGVLFADAQSAYAQSAKVDLNVTNGKLNTVLNKIEKQTDYLFIYNNEVNTDIPANVSVKGEVVSSVLNRVLRGTGITYKLEGSHIILSAGKQATGKQATKKVKGRVLDAAGEPIVGASVRVKGQKMGTVTDIDGNFELNADPKSVLEVSYIGFRPQEIAVGNQTALNIAMREDNKALDEVVVIGYGVQKKADLTGSVANIKADKLNTQSNSSIAQALQGKIAGVDIVSQGGTPGAGTRVMVRGIGTLNNAAPLYIVDGMYMDGIDHINPNDIESIDVLKDASSAAIYGSRAANGVVIVTTKEGSNTEGKPVVDFSVNLGVSSPSKYLDLLDAKGWAEVTTVARQAAGMQPLEMAQDLASKTNNDWQDIMFGPALMQNYNLSVKGGGKHSTYYNSVGYTNQDGTMKGTNYQRYTLQSKQDFKRGMFQAGTNVVLSYDQNNPLWGNVRGGMVGHTIQAVPTMEMYDASRVGGYGSLYGDVVNLTHPLVLTDNELMTRRAENVKIYANLYVSIEPLKGLKYKLNFTPDFQFYRYNGLGIVRLWHYNQRHHTGERPTDTQAQHSCGAPALVRPHFRCT